MSNADTKRAPEMTDVAAALGCKTDGAKSRLVALGYVKACSRCGGGGHYSYNQIDGTKCFGCSGSGKQMVKLTWAIVAEAKARQEAGELDAYFARNRARAAAKKEIEPALEALKSECGDGGIRAHYGRHNSEGISSHVFVNSDYFRASSMLCALSDAAFQAWLDWKYSGAACEATLAVIREMTAYAQQVNAAAAPMVDAWYAQMAIDEVAHRAQVAVEQAAFEAQQAREAEERKAFVAREAADRFARYGV